MRIFAIVYSIAAAIVAIVTTFMEVQPARFFMELTLNDENEYVIQFVFILTMFALLLPLVIFLIIIKLLNNGGAKNVMPDLNGRTGIVVQRKKALSNALYDSYILVNNEQKGIVSNGKSTFIELAPGTYTVSVKAFAGATTDVVVQRGEIAQLLLSFVDDGGIKVKVLLEQQPAQI